MKYKIQVRSDATYRRHAVLEIEADDLEEAKELACGYAASSKNPDGTELELDEEQIGNGPWTAELVWTGKTDDAGEPIRFRNHYSCEECQETWEDDWSCRCNDECPDCGAEIEPYHTDDLDENGDAV